MTASHPRRLVLNDVPRVGFYDEARQHPDSAHRCPEDVPLASVLRACLDYLEGGLGCRASGVGSSRWRLGCAYAFLLGVSGLGFRLHWKPGWHPDNVASILVFDDPSEVFRRPLNAVGYGCEVIFRSSLSAPSVRREQGRDSIEALRGAIVDSIAHGRPAIARGVIGPPEECIITGYDDGGEVLVGWSFFQNMPPFNAGVEFEPNGMFRKRDWYESTEAVVLIGDKQAAPSLEEAYADALRCALGVIRAPRRHGDRHNGLAAYDAWADHLLKDDDFATDDMSVLRDRHMAHDDAVATVAECRWYAGVFLAEAAFVLPQMAAELYAAAGCCARQHDLMWKLWGLVGGLGRDDEQVRRFADADVRRRMAPIVREAREQDAKLAEHIERALAGTS